MIDYERFLESFELVDLEAGDSDSVIATMRARAAPPRPTGGGGSPSPSRRSRRPPPEGTPEGNRRAVRLIPIRPACAALTARRPVTTLCQLQVMYSYSWRSW
jgi:hypothetical protein